MKYYKQPESTLEKINNEFKKLYEADNNLIDILAHAGLDPETQYTQARLDIIEDSKALQKALHALLDNHNSVVMDLEYELEPTPVRKLNSIAKHMATEAIGVAQRTGRCFY